MEYDSDKSGKISFLEFKRAFKKIGGGIGSHEIDKLIEHCDEDDDEEIDYQEFVSHFKLNKLESQIQSN